MLAAEVYCGVRKRLRLGRRKHAHFARTLILYAVITYLRNALRASREQHIDALLDGFGAAVHVVAKIGLGIEGLAPRHILGKAALLILTI